MKKQAFKPSTLLAPLPVIMATTGESEKEYNIITIAWTGIINSDPLMTYISVKKARHSHSILSKTMEYVINLPPESLVRETDFCGVKSGKDLNKFEKLNLTPISAEIVKAPMILECPINIECKVVDIISYPSHDMFVSEVVRVHVADDLLDENDKIQLGKGNLICYINREYYGIKPDKLGSFGYSVVKAKT